MKIITTRKANKIHPEYGKVLQVTFYIFNLKFWTENNPVEVDHPEEKFKYDYDLEEMTGYAEWREKMKLMRLSDEEFTQIINTRF